MLPVQQEAPVGSVSGKERSEAEAMLQELKETSSKELWREAHAVRRKNKTADVTQEQNWKIFMVYGISSGATILLKDYLQKTPSSPT